MNKRRLHHRWTQIRRIRPWYFLAVSLVFGLIFLASMRHNNLVMIQLRDKVTQADQQNGDVETALRNLREYVYAHMNTDLASGPNAIHPPIQLKYRYDRLVQAEKDRAANANTQVYTDAQHYCEQLFPGSFSGGPRVPCIKDYVSSHGTTEQTIPDALYKFDFVSPSWSPDLAGWSLVATILSFVLFLVFLLLDKWMKSSLRASTF